MLGLLHLQLLQIPAPLTLSLLVAYRRLSLSSLPLLLLSSRGCKASV